MFLKVVTHMEVDGPASLKLVKYAETQGAYEGMDAHRFAAAIRLRNLKEWMYLEPYLLNLFIDADRYVIILFLGGLGRWASKW